jgi:zeaxanthin glucosyltransferase
MSHFGILCPSAIGHLNPMCSIGRELQRRGHRVTLFGVPDVGVKVAKAGLEFREIGATVFPLGRIDQMFQKLGELSNLDALKYTIEWLKQETVMLLAEAPGAIQGQNINLLLVDQVTVAGGTVADFLQIPFVTICNALPVNREPDVPPFFTHWTYQNTGWARLRNQLGYSLLQYLTQGVWQLVASQRQRWQLPVLANPEASFSRLAQICQLPPGFDFPRVKQSACFYETGPFQALGATEPVTFAGIEFPFDRLTGQPLIYASLGTLQNRQWEIFECIASACMDLDAQLVISLGNAQQDPNQLQLPGQPIVVAYAPHAQLIARSTLIITHGGLNTVMGSLNAGVPMVVIPITNEQPGIATRLVRTGAGEMVTLKQLNSGFLRQKIDRVLGDEQYRLNAHRMQMAMQAAGGVQKATDIILSVCPK